jgi:hypothetical protein
VQVLVEPIITPTGDRLAVTTRVNDPNGRPVLTYHEVRADAEVQGRLRREPAALAGADARFRTGPVLTRHTDFLGYWQLDPADPDGSRLLSGTYGAGLPVQVLVEAMTTPDGDRLAVIAQVEVEGRPVLTYHEVPASAELQGRLLREPAALSGADARFRTGPVLTRRTVGQGGWFLDPADLYTDSLPSGAGWPGVPVQVLVEPITTLDGDRLAVTAQAVVDGEPVLSYHEVRADAELLARLRREPAALGGADARLQAGPVLTTYTDDEGAWSLDGTDRGSALFPSGADRAGVPVQVLIEPIATAGSDRFAITTRVDVDGRPVLTYHEVPASARVRQLAAAIAIAAARRAGSAQHSDRREPSTDA